MHRHLTAHGTRNAAGPGFGHLTWYTAGLGDHPGIANLTAGGVRNLTGPDFTAHRAGRVRDLLGDAVAGPGASGVGHLLGHALGGPGAGGIRNTLCAGLTGHRAGRVRNTLGAGLTLIPYAGARNLLAHLVRHTAAGGVRNLALTDFPLVPGAADGLHFGTWAPDLAADGAGWALFTDHTAAAGLVHAAAGARIKFPGPWIADAALDHWARNLFGDSLPIAGANRNLACFGNRTANGMADRAIAGFRLHLVLSTADSAVGRFIDRAADVVADVFVAGLETRLANRVADIAVAGVVDRTANLACDVFVAGLEAGLPDGACDVFVASLEARLADGVAFIAVAGLVDVACAGDRNLLANLVVHGTAGGVLLLLPDHLSDGLVAGVAVVFGGDVFATGGTGIGRAALVAAGATVRGAGVLALRQPDEGCQHDHPGCVSHCSVLIPVRTAVVSVEVRGLTVSTIFPLQVRSATQSSRMNQPAQIRAASILNTWSS